MKLVEVDSSMIQAISYNLEEKELMVIFNNGKIYYYTEVPQEEYNNLLKADSKGSYMRGNIIDFYPYYQGRRKRK